MCLFRKKLIKKTIYLLSLFMIYTIINSSSVNAFSLMDNTDKEIFIEDSIVNYSIENSTMTSFPMISNNTSYNHSIYKEYDNYLIKSNDNKLQVHNLKANNSFIVFQKIYDKTIVDVQIIDDYLLIVLNDLFNPLQFFSSTNVEMDSINESDLIFYNLNELNFMNEVHRMSISGNYENIIINNDSIFIITNQTCNSTNVYNNSYLPYYIYNTKKRLINMEHVSLVAQDNCNSFLNIISLNKESLTFSSPFRSVFGMGDRIFIDNNYIYTIKKESNYSDIKKFALSDDKLEFIADNSIMGGLLDNNSFSIYDNKLRLVVNTKNGNSYHSGIFILDENLDILNFTVNEENQLFHNISFDKNLLNLYTQPNNVFKHYAFTEDNRIIETAADIEILNGNSFNYDESKIFIGYNAEEVFKVNILENENFSSFNVTDLFGENVNISSNLTLNKNIIFDTNKEKLIFPVQLFKDDLYVEMILIFNYSKGILEISEVVPYTSIYEDYANYYNADFFTEKLILKGDSLFIYSKEVKAVYNLNRNTF